MRRRGLGVLLVVAAAVIAVVVAVLVGGGTAKARHPAPRLPTTVLKPPRVTLATLRGQPAAINFWASWCAPCNREAPGLERLSRSFAGRARIVGVNYEDGAKPARGFVRRHRWTFPILTDPNGTAGERYRLIGLPETFILDRRGRIAQVLRGQQDEASVRRALIAAGA